MIVIKPRKLSQNTRETISANSQRKDSFISSVTQQKKKSAAETASSILEELGVKKSSSTKAKKNNLLNVKKEIKQKKKSNLDLEVRGSRILDDLLYQKNENSKKNLLTLGNKKNETEESQKEGNKLKNKNKKVSQSSQFDQKFGFHEKLVFFVLSCVLGIGFLAYIGGYIKIFDMSVIRQIFTGSAHQLEFVGEFEARQVENGYNRVPLFVVEGNIRNSFNESDNIEKIQLKAFSFDYDQNLIDSHFTYTGIVLSDEQLETLSPMNIKALRQSSDLNILNSLERIESQSNSNEKKSMQIKDLTFQVVFFKDVSMIKSTSIEIVSYVRNNKLIFLGTSNRN